MIDITIKTLDSMNHQFSVQDDLTVKKFKEHIASSVNIPAESQRLIYCGRVLADDKKLTDYDVNGKVIHLVQRAPPSTNPDTGTTNSEPRSTTRNPFRTFNQAMRLDGANGNTMYLGAMAFPAEIMDAQGIQVPQSIQGLSQNRINVWRNMLRRARILVLGLENPTEQSQNTTQTQPQPSSNVNVVNVQNLENMYPMVAHALSEAMNQISDDGPPSIINLDPARRTREEPAPDTSSSSSPVDPSMINDLLLNYTPEEGQQSAEQAESSGETSRNGRARSSGSTMSNCTTVALLIDQLRDVNRRIMPYLDMYHDMMRDDAPLDNPADTQRLFNRVSELMHYLAHAYHAMSDVICDFSQPPPRTLRCRPVLIQHSAVLQAGIPIQLNLEGSIGRRSGATETESASGSTPSAQASSTPQQERPAGSSQSSPRTEPPRPSRVSFAPELEVVVDVNTEIIPDVEAIGSLFGGRENNAGSRAEPELAQNVIQSIIENIMVHHNIYPGNSRNSEGRNEDNIWRNDASSQESRNDSRWRSGSDDPSGSHQVWSSTETWPTTSTNTRSTTRPHVHMASSLGGLGNSVQGYFDPFLPCNSHHIRSNRRRNQTQQSETTEAASAASETESTASTMSNAENSEETPRREPTGIHSMINRLIEGEGQTNRGRNMRMLGLQRLNNDNTIVFHIPNRRNNFPRFTPYLRSLQDTMDNTAQPNLLTHLIRLVISNIRLMDFWTLDVTQIWTSLHSGLVQYVNEHLLRGDPNATGARRREAFRNAAERLNTQLRPAFQAFQDWISNMLTRDESNIDVIASINELNKFYFPQIIELINESESHFVRQFPKYLNDYIQSLASLIHNMCHPHNTTRDVIETAFIALGSMVLFSVPRVDLAIHHHLIREWRSFACTITANNPTDQSFIVRRNTGRPEEQNASSSHSSQPVNLTPLTHPTPPVAAPQPPPPLQAMEIEDPETEGVPTAEQITEPLPDVIIGAEQWHNHVPSDWVPIITRDRERQRRQPSQGPLSDAYLNGMPSKRRKIVSSAKPHGNLSHVISDSMTTAMGAAGVSPIESVAEDAGADLALRSAYKEQVKTTIEAQLKKNPDYKPEKYPNSAKLFGPKN